MHAGELALQGCTVHVHDGDPIRLQTVHSVIQGQLQELKERGLLDHDAKPKANKLTNIITLMKVNIIERVTKYSLAGINISSNSKMIVYATVHVCRYGRDV